MIENHSYALAVEDLFVGAINAQPITVEDWPRKELKPGGAWSYWEAVDYQILNDTYPIVVRNGRHIKAVMDANGVMADLDDIEAYLEDADEGSFSEDWLTTLKHIKGVRKAEGPQMNYWYPLDGIYETPVAAAMALRSVALCVVEVDGKFGLALTGGGMDMSWSICAAYVSLGYLPPRHYADLPNMAGNKPDRYVLAAMLRTLAVTAEQATTAAELLKEKFPPVEFEYEIQGKFAGGWEMVTTETTPEDAEAMLNTYRQNDPVTAYRVKKVPTDS